VKSSGLVYVCLDWVIVFGVSVSSVVVPSESIDYCGVVGVLPVVVFGWGVSSAV